MRKKKKRTLRRWLIRMLFHLILLCLLAGALGLGVLWLAETHPAPATHQTDAIVVLGAQVYSDGSLSPQLELRMEAALSSYHENPRLIITCGAQGNNEPCPEGEAMRNWLLEKGVPHEHVLAENNSYNTYQNIENAQALLPEDTDTVTLITSDYHLPRSIAISRDAGLKAEGIGSPCKPEYWIKNHTREVLAWGKYLLKQVIPIE